MTKPEAQGHTPTPWMLDHDDRPRMEWNIHIVQEAAPAMRICFMTSDGPSEANAVLIVTAVNSHASLKQRVEELEAALTQLLPTIRSVDEETTAAIEAARKALSPRGET